MMVNCFINFIIKVLHFITINLLSIRDSVDTQITDIPYIKVYIKLTKNASGKVNLMYVFHNKKLVDINCWLIKNT